MSQAGCVGLPVGDAVGFDFIVCSPPGPPDAALAIAGSRAGALGVLDLEFAAEASGAGGALARLAALGRGRRGALVDAGSGLLEVVLDEPFDGLDAILLAGASGDGLDR